MNTLKTIYDKLGDKTELAKHEIELGLADDVKKAFNESINARKKAFEEYQKLKTILASALKMQIELQSINQKAIPIFAKFEQGAKDLGIPLPKEILDQKKNIEDGLKGTFLNNIKAIQSTKL